MELQPVIGVTEDLCVNCHACITACPVKFCNDGSGKTVIVNANMCIACGNCLQACTHNARYFIDDFDVFLKKLNVGEKLIAVVAPSVASSFPNKYLNLNSWLREAGVEAVFDVSFGAELATKSYVEHLKNKPEGPVIAQPCAAIVSYIEIYQPELLKYLAPVDSPIVHTIKMVKEYFPQYANYKIAVISPCIAKKREFNEVGLGDYNVSFKAIAKHLADHNILLEYFNKSGYDNPEAERAVLFSNPGGLLQTAERWVSGITEQSRKIEGVEVIYEYLKQLPEAVEKGFAPVIVDCLNCSFGCNTGPVTLTENKSVDEIEVLTKKRKAEMQAFYKEKTSDEYITSVEKIEETVNSYWTPGLYTRKYTNLWENMNLTYPDSGELKEIFVAMHKYSDADFYNCSSCGYGTCERMAVAIFNKLNRPENCHFYLAAENEAVNKNLSSGKKRLQTILDTSQDGFLQINSSSVLQMVNPSMKKILKRNDLVGRKITEFLDEGSKVIYQKNMELRMKGEKSSYELTMIQSDGNQVYVLVSGTPLFDDETGHIIGSFAMLSDITPLKVAQKELEENNQQLELRVKERTAELEELIEELRATTETIRENSKQLAKLSIIADKTSNAVLITDAGGNLEWVNKGFQHMFGFNYDDFIEKFGLNLITFSSHPQIREVLNKVIFDKENVSYESKFVRPDGSQLWTQTTLTPILSENGLLRNIVAIDSDITVLKLAEQEIQLKSVEMSELIEELRTSSDIIESINAELEAQNLEIEQQRDSATQQRDLLDEQKRDITDSIQYAGRIQQALLPPNHLFIEMEKDFFVLLKPRDIVSGDFYWIRKHSDNVCIAVADCTGHGVPGAFMSMLGISYLNDVTSTILTENKSDEFEISPADVLTQMREKVKYSLHQHQGKNGRDGMDMALLRFNLKTGAAKFAGANLSALIIRNNEIIKLRGDKMPVGMHIKEREFFTDNEFALLHGDRIYMFSDGYVDQFGGPMNKKFGIKQFKELLLQINQLPMKEQNAIIDKTMMDWQKFKNEKNETYHQIDDVLVFGMCF